MQVKIFSVGDDRPLKHFVSDDTIHIRDIVVIGKFETAKEIEIAMLYAANKSKTTKNNFLNLRNPRHMVEKKLNEVFKKCDFHNLHLNSYSTARSLGYTVFYETKAGN